MTISGIYGIRNKLNNKIYIGSSKNIEARWRVHKSRLRLKKHHSEHLQKSCDINGLENFSFEVLEEIQDIAQLEIREQHWVNEYQSYRSEFGYNAVKTVSKTDPQRMIERWAKPGAREEQSELMKEICSTEEHRKKLSEGHKKFYSDPQTRIDKMFATPHRKEVQCIETGKIYPSINAAAKELGVSLVKIRDSANGKRKSKILSFKWV